MKYKLETKSKTKLLEAKNPARLDIINGADQGVQYQLRGDEITIGRESSNDIVIDDKQASRLHAIISREGESYYLKDLNSQNGTIVNGQSASLVELGNGDEISIGETKFKFNLEIYDNTEHEGTDSHDDLGPIQPRKPRFTLWILLSIAATGVYWGISSPTKVAEKQNVTREPLSIPPPNLTEAPSFAPEEKQTQETNSVAADHLYQKGFRELMSKNYLRAIHFFEAALTLYPDHQSSKAKLARTQEEITKSIDGSFNLGRKYFENHQWRRSIYYFERAMLLLDKKQDSHTFLESERLAQEAREKLNPSTIYPLEAEEE